MVDFIKYYAKGILAFVSSVLVYVAGIGLPHPWDYIIGAALFALGTAGVVAVPNGPKPVATDTTAPAPQTPVA